MQVRAHPQASPATVAMSLLVVIFWLAAALLVIAVHRLVAPHSEAACVALKVLSIAAAAGIYVRVTERATSLQHTLLVGTIWLTLSILTEIVVSMHTGRGWFEMLGPPDSALRNVVMFAWVFGPALFVHGSADEQ